MSLDKKITRNFQNLEFEPKRMKRRRNVVPIRKTAFKVKELKGELKEEPMLSEDPNRFVLFPLQHMDIWNFYKKAVASFCTVFGGNLFTK